MDGVIWATKTRLRRQWRRTYTRESCCDVGGGKIKANRLRGKFLLLGPPTPVLPTKNTSTGVLESGSFFRQIYVPTNRTFFFHRPQEESMQMKKSSPNVFHVCSKFSLDMFRLIPVYQSSVCTLLVCIRKKD